MLVLMRFADWMTRAGETNAGFGVKAGWSGETVRRYRTGDREPDKAAMAVIFRLTNGAVTPNDWVGVGPRTDAAVGEEGAVP